MTKILLYGGGLQGLACGEALHDVGAEVDAISNDLMVRKSRWFGRVYDEVTSDDELVEIIRNGGYDVVIPMGDTSVASLVRLRTRIEGESGAKCACPDERCLSIVEDKGRFMEWCRTNNVPCPRTERIDLTNEDEVAARVGFPAMIKPDFSVGARGVTRVNTIDELKSKLPAIIEKFGNCTLQEFVENDEYYYNVMMYRNAEGRTLGEAVIKIVRKYPVAAGSSSCCMSVVNDELTAICRDCLEKMNWVGMADFDVLQRMDNKEYKVIEINPRVPASLRAATVSGVNFPAMMVADLNGGGICLSIKQIRPYAISESTLCG